MSSPTGSAIKSKVSDKISEKTSDKVTDSGTEQSHRDTPAEALESIPAKSPHRKYLVLLALHMIHTDDPRVFSDATDCSERTFHYVKSRLCKHDGVIISYDRRAGRYIVVHSGVLDMNRVAELMRRHYPRRFANIERLAIQSRAGFIG